MSAIISKLKKKLRKTDKLERCGLILKDMTIIETENVSETPETSFAISGEDLLKYENDLYGTWHTHPGAGANLSHQDREGFLQWPLLTHHIIGTDGVRIFVVDNKFVIEI